MVTRIRIPTGFEIRNKPVQRGDVRDEAIAVDKEQRIAWDCAGNDVLESNHSNVVRDLARPLRPARVAIEPTPGAVTCLLNPDISEPCMPEMPDRVLENRQVPMVVTND